LGAPELARIFAAATPSGQKHPVNLADQAVRKREAAAQALESMLEGGDVIRHLHDIVERDARGLIELEE
jgi:hypothetical protein